MDYRIFARGHPLDGANHFLVHMVVDLRNGGWGIGALSVEFALVQGLAKWIRQERTNGAQAGALLPNSIIHLE